MLTGPSTCTGPHPHEFSSARLPTQIQHIGVVPSLDLGIAPMRRDGHSLQGRRDRIGDGEPVQEGIDRHVICVAQL